MSEKPITQTRLQLFAHGYVDLLPIEGKRPPMERWSQRPATNVDEIKLWPRSYPHAKNTGCLTRAMPTLDLDILNEEAAIAAEDLVRERYEERGYILPRIGKPPKRAVPFRTNEPFPKITVNFEDTDEKIELLSNGQQVVLYGVHPATGKPYNWPRGAPIDVDHADLPYISAAEAQRLVDDIAELLTREFGYVRAESRPMSNGADTAGQADWKYLYDRILKGQDLHNSLRDLAAKLVRSGMSAGAAVNQLRALMDASTAARDYRWQERYDDIARAVDSAGAKYHGRQQAPEREVPPTNAADPEAEPTDGAEKSSDQQQQETESKGPNGQQQQQKQPRFVLKPFHTIGVSTAPTYLVKGILPRVGLAVVWGPPKCGKSFWTFDLVMHIAIGRHYRERKVQQGTVVYCALEGGSGFAGRVDAWRQLRLAEHDQAVPFYLLDVPLNLIAEHRALIEAIRGQLTGYPAIVVIDTLNRGLVGNENDSEDMAKFIRAADAVRVAFNCLVVVVHHCGVANNRPRGHTSLAGADDAQISVERDKEGLVIAKVELMKDGEAGAVLTSKLERVELGTDTEGDPISSCVISPAADLGAAGPKLNKTQRFAFDLLQKLIASPDDGVAAPADAPLPTGTRVCLSDTWRKRFYETYPADKQDTKKKALLRATLDLEQEGLIELWREYVGVKERDNRDKS